MPEPIVIVRAAPEGFRWRVVADGHTVGMGTAATEFEAQRLEAKPPEAP